MASRCIAIRPMYDIAAQHRSQPSCNKLGVDFDKGGETEYFEKKPLGSRLIQM